MPDQESAMRQCPFCKEEVKIEAIRCMHCQANLASAGASFHERSSGGFSPALQTSAPVLRLRHASVLPHFCSCSGRASALKRSDRASVCPPAIMDSSTKWCLVESDEESCTYEACGYV